MVLLDSSLNLFEIVLGVYYRFFILFLSKAVGFVVLDGNVGEKILFSGDVKEFKHQISLRRSKIPCKKRYGRRG